MDLYCQGGGGYVTGSGKRDAEVWTCIVRGVGGDVTGSGNRGTEVWTCFVRGVVPVTTHCLEYYSLDHRYCTDTRYFITSTQYL